MKCPQCGAAVEDPGPDHRYCPMCGQMLVMCDSGDGAESTSYLVLGRHAVGPQTGNIYRYEAPLQPPYRVDPLIAAPAGRGRGADLFGSSHAPPGTDVVHWSPVDSGATRHGERWNTTRDLTSVAARHGLLYTVASHTYQVEAWDVRLGRRVAQWAFSEAQMDGLQPHTGLRVSETLVYGVCRAHSGGLLTLRAIHAGTGQMVFDHTIRQTDAQAAVVGGRAYVVGDAHDEMMAIAALDINGPSVHPCASASIELMPDAPANPWPTAMAVLADDVLVFAARDGRIYTWRPEDGAGPTVAYAPPAGYGCQGHVYDLGQGAIGFMFQAETVGAAPLLARIGGEGSSAHTGVAGLPRMPSRPHDRCLAVCGAYLFACVHRPGEALRIVKRRADLDQGGWDAVTTLSGTQRARRVRLQAVPERHASLLCLQVVQDSTRSAYVIDSQTGSVAPVDMHPHAEDDVRIAWTGGASMRINLTSGNVQVLG